MALKLGASIALLAASNAEHTLFQTDGTCQVDEAARNDCQGMSSTDCENKGCCWQPIQPNPNNRPWCFHKGEGPAPSPPPPGPPAPAPPSPGPRHGYPVGARDAFVHLFEWSWSDVAKECEEWLGPKGFRAVQVSPPNEHIKGDDWWTRYQPVTYQLVSRSGDEAAFKDMIQRCKAAGVDVYADAVFNHIAAGSGQGVAGSNFGGRSTPIYSKDDMHHNQGDDKQNCGITNYADKHNVQYCDLVGLPDLCTSCDKVQQNVARYINNMADLGIAGFRIDAAKHMDAGELAQLLSHTKDGLFRFQEVISGAGEAVSPEMYVATGEVTEFNYARKLFDNFLEPDHMQYLGTFGESWGLMKGTEVVVFLDNHDTQRGESKLTYKNGKLYEFTNLFLLAHPYGYPKVMSSYYFDSHDQGPPHSPVHGSGKDVNCGAPPDGTGNGPWVCEHRWTPVANMVNWRLAAGQNGVTEFEAADGNKIKFCRGSEACIAMNRGTDWWKTTVHFGMKAGKYCDVIQSDDTSSCPQIEVRADGSADINVPPLSAVAVHTGRIVKLAELQQTAFVV